MTAAHATETRSNDVLTSVLASDLALRANCYTFDPFKGLREGIELSLDRGPDPLRPWEPFVVIGSFRLHRDNWFDREVKRPLGCVYHPHGDTATVRRAVINYVVLPNEKSFPTLRKPVSDAVEECLLDARHGMAGAVKIGDYKLRIWSGVSGSATPIAQQGDHSFLRLKKGEDVDLFLADGRVRRFYFDGEVLKETVVSFIEMGKLRVNNAHERLTTARSDEDLERRDRKVYGVLAGMADLIHLTVFGGGDGPQIRQLILREFFGEISQDLLSKIHRKLTAILHQVDSALLPMISTRGEEIGESVLDLVILADRFPVRIGKTERKRRARAEGSVGVNPTNVPGQGPAKGSSHGKEKKKK